MKRNPPPKEDLGPNDIVQRRALLDLLASDVERQLNSAQVVSAAMGTRAAILIASASLITSLHSVGSLGLNWYTFALTTGVVSALIGIMVVLPRASKEVGVIEIENDA